MGLVGDTMSGTGDSSRFSRLGLSGTRGNIVMSRADRLYISFYQPGGSRENCEK